jgi:hypothetical protein
MGCQVFEQSGHVVGIGGIVSGIPGGSYARCPVQGFHTQAGIIGHGRISQDPGRECGFFVGIVVKGGPVLDDRRDGAEIGQVFDVQGIIL